jgi:hypothetical protein
MSVTIHPRHVRLFTLQPASGILKGNDASLLSFIYTSGLNIPRFALFFPLVQSDSISFPL